MAAWNNAVLINTVASYQSFLGQFPNSDLTATAQKLIERLRYRPVVAATATAASLTPTNVALGPTCPCTPAPQPTKKADAPKTIDAKPSKKRDEPPKRANSRPSRDRTPGDDVVYDPPVRDYYGPPPMAGPAIRFGIGGGYRGGGGYYGRAPAGYPSRSTY